MLSLSYGANTGLKTRLRVRIWVWSRAKCEGLGVAGPNRSALTHPKGIPHPESEEMMYKWLYRAVNARDEARKCEEMGVKNGQVRGNGCVFSAKCEEMGVA